MSRKGLGVLAFVALGLVVAAVAFTLPPLRSYLPSSISSYLVSSGRQNSLDRVIVAVLSRGDGDEEPGWYADSVFVVMLDGGSGKARKARAVRAVIVPGTTKTMVPGVTFKQVRYGYAFGGGTLLRDAVNRALRTDVEDYLVVADVTLARAIDRMGGVPFEVKEDVNTYIDGEYEIIRQGRQVLGGTRFRHLLYHYGHLPFIEGGAGGQSELAAALVAATLKDGALGRAGASTSWKGVETSLSPGELVSVSKAMAGMAAEDLAITLLPGRYMGPPVADEAAGGRPRRVGWQPDLRPGQLSE